MTRPRGLVVLAILAMGVLAFAIARGQGWMVDRDFFTYWGGGRGILDGVNLYDTRAWFAIHQVYGSNWFPNPVFIYAPPTAILFAPLATLRVDVAGITWIWLSEIFVALAVVMIARNLGWVRLARFAPFLAAAIALFMPVLLTLLMGQASALLLVLVVAAAVLWDRGRWFAGGLLLGWTIVKPQPVVFLIPMLGLWLMLNRRWRALFGLALSLGVSAMAGFTLFPGFVQDWQVVAATKVGGVAARMPTVWGLSADLFGVSPLATGSAVALIVLTVGASVVLVVRWKEERALALMGALLIPALLVTPYLWNYDQALLLVPFLIALIRLDQRGVPFWTIALLPFVLDGVAIILLGIASLRVRDSLSALMPVLVGAILWVARRN